LRHVRQRPQALFDSRAEEAARVNDNGVGVGGVGGDAIARALQQAQHHFAIDEVFEHPNETRLTVFCTADNYTKLKQKLVARRFVTSGTTRHL
jgi:hypothetical protein